MRPIGDIAILWSMVRDGRSTRCILSMHGPDQYELRVEHGGDIVERAVEDDETHALAVAQEWRRRYAEAE